MAPTRENLPPQVIQRVAKEIRRLVQAPPSGIRYLPQEEEVLTDIHVEIAGPENTPYEGAYFHIRLSLSDGYPQTPPKGVFLTKIFHPNIANNGEICVNTLKRDWTPTVELSHVLQVIRCLLIVPFPESSLNDEAGKLFMESYDEYARRARLMANIHAPKKSAAKAFETLKKTTENNKQSPLKAGGENKEKEQREPETSEEQTVAATKSLPTVSTTSDKTLPLTKKRTSPTSTDALAAAQKKKSTLKKGIKRL